MLAAIGLQPPWCKLSAYLRPESLQIERSETTSISNAASYQERHPAGHQGPKLAMNTHVWILLWLLCLLRFPCNVKLPRKHTVAVVYALTTAMTLSPCLAISFLMLLPMIFVARTTLSILCAFGVCRRVDGTAASYVLQNRVPCTYVPIQCAPLAQLPRLCICPTTTAVFVCWAIAGVRISYHILIALCQQINVRSRMFFHEQLR